MTYGCKALGTILTALFEVRLGTFALLEAKRHPHPLEDLDIIMNLERLVEVEEILVSDTTEKHTIARRRVLKTKTKNQQNKCNLTS